LWFVFRAVGEAGRGVASDSGVGAVSTPQQQKQQKQQFV
jgi:hypothetical protein